MNTHESYVSLEIAKLLKQLGFDWHCKGYFNGEEFHPDGSVECTNYFSQSQYLKAPTLCVAQRWLREVKGIDVESVLCVNRGTPGHSFGFSIAEVSADLSTLKLLYPSTYFDEEETKGFIKYELSLEAGIKKALELILEKGE